MNLLPKVRRAHTSLVTRGPLQRDRVKRGNNKMQQTRVVYTFFSDDDDEAALSSISHTSITLHGKGKAAASAN